MTSIIGKYLGRYHIIEQIGQGGMATVYKAFDTRLETNVAVKIIRLENLAPSLAERALKRFEREAKAVAQLNHPNIVKVTDYGDHEGMPYLVMPFLEGGTLKQLIKERGKFDWRESIRLLKPIARALDYAHHRGMIHRDIKPANILITDSGEPMLSDFGVAKIIDIEGTADLTGTNATIGTPEYMAPEQATAKTVDHRADIYALGVVLYEMLTGRKPYEADTPIAVLIKHASESLPRPSQFTPDLPEQVEQVLIKALAKQPDDRYQDAKAFITGIENVSEIPHPETKIQKYASETSKQIPKQESKQKPISWQIIIIGAVLLLVSLAALFVLLGTLNLPVAKQPTPTDTQTVTALPTKSVTPSTIPTNTPSATVTLAPDEDAIVGNLEKCQNDSPNETCYHSYRIVGQTLLLLAYVKDFIPTQLPFVMIDGQEFQCQESSFMTAGFISCSGPVVKSGNWEISVHDSNGKQVSVGEIKIDIFEATSTPQPQQFDSGPVGSPTEEPPTEEPPTEEPPTEEPPTEEPPTEEPPTEEPPTEEP